jgi:CBS domain-containing protein
VVERIMRQHFVAGDPEEPLHSALETMRLARLRHLLVSREERLLGIVSYRELLETLLAERPTGAADPRRLGDVMTPSPSFVTPRTPLAQAAERMTRYGIGCLPVLSPPASGAAEQGRLVGIVTEADLLRAAYSRF